MQNKDPKPEISRLEELALLVKSGDIKLPKFQRPFVWQRSDMRNLLDSIYKGYPIGSLLIWNSSHPLTSERSISGLDVNTDENAYFPTNYLLDGQQRLTTLCGALFWNGEDPSSIWNIQFNLDDELFVHPKEPNLVNHFPLNKLIQTSDFIQQCMKFNAHPKKDEYFKKAERLLKSIKDYKIAVVKIGDMTIDEVAPIFERINSTGRKLTIVDLMMAATWSGDFDLTSEITSINKACAEIGFDGIGDSIILRSISASAGLGINKLDIQKLRSKNSSELSEAANVARQSITRALKFLRNNIGVCDYSYLPYGFQFTYLAELFRLLPSPSPEIEKHLVEWFWFTSTTRYFGSSNTGQVSKDLALIRSYATGDISRLFEQKEIDISKLLFDNFNMRNATSTTFAVLLNSKRPSQTLDGLVIDESHLTVKSNKFFQSFSPKNNMIEKLNISMVIHPYSQPIKEGAEACTSTNILAHMLNDECIRFRNAADINGFLFERSRLIADLVASLTGCPVTYSSLEIFSRMNHANEIDDTTVNDMY